MTTNKLKIVFMGSPTEVVAPLKALMQLESINLGAVVSQPARPFGRKRVLTDPPVAQFSKEEGLLTLQPESAKDEGFLSELRAISPDLIVTAAYGQILSQAFLSIPKLGTINLHPSLLPLYRGATPVQSSLLNGDAITGITVLYTVKELDAGDIIFQKEMVINKGETAGDLMLRLFEAYSEFWPEVFNRICTPEFKPKQQDPNKVTHCKKIQKTDGLVNWDQPATKILNQFQGLTPWPGLYSFSGKKRVLFTSMELPSLESQPTNLSPGEFVPNRALGSILVKCEDSFISVKSLKPAGSIEVDSMGFWNGGRFDGKGKFHDQLP